MAVRIVVFGVILTILLCSPLASSGSDSGYLVNTSSQFCYYVTPDSSTPCSTGIHYPCLTLNDYVKEANEFFVDDSTFYFSPGNHHLNIGLNLTKVHNVSFLGDGVGGVTLMVDQPISFVLSGCKNVEIINITFNVRDRFKYILVVNLNSFVKVSNVTILGNEHSGCSSIISEQSVINIADSRFVGINGYLGAALSAVESNITIETGSAFANNTALSGGAIYCYSSFVFLFGTTIFLRNTAVRNYPEENELMCKEYVNIPLSGSGGAIYCFNSSLESIECSIKSEYFFRFFNSLAYCSFMNRSGSSSSTFDADGKSVDCCMLAVNSSYCSERCDFSSITTRVCGTLVFRLNSAQQFGGALLLESTSQRFCGKVFLESNSALMHGGAIYLTNAKLLFHCSHAVFHLNAASETGGSIFSKNSSLHLQGYIIFHSSRAKVGGALLLVLNSFLTFQYSESAVSISNETVSYGCGCFCLVNNTANDGGAIYIDTSNIFSVNCNAVSAGTSSERSVSYDDSLYADNCNSILKLSTSPVVIFRKNKANYSGGSIFARRDSHLYLMGTVLFEDNIADYGGAMYLDETSQLILKPLLSVVFTRNVAREKGGAILYRHLVKERSNQCFFSMGDSGLKMVSLKFTNNSALASGTVLYWVEVDNCDLSSRNDTIQQQHTNCSRVFKSISNITAQTDAERIRLLSADVNYLSFCPDPLKHGPLYHTVRSVNLYPGQKFNVTLATIEQAQLFAISEIIYRVKIPNLYAISDIQLRQELPLTAVNSTCANVFYSLSATKAPNSATIQFYHDNFESCDSLVGRVYLNVSVQPCPLGFKLSTEEQRCICDERLQMVIDKCDIDNLAFKRNRNSFWISDLSLVNDNGIFLHKFGCPFGYCKSEPVSVTLDASDVQCYGNRRGVLCGQCRETYSLALGSLHCLKCTSKSYIAFIFPFAFTGIVLVILTFLYLHVTVDIGTLNGLTFYVNIVQANRQAFFLEELSTCLRCS